MERPQATPNKVKKSKPRHREDMLRDNEMAKLRENLRAVDARTDIGWEGEKRRSVSFDHPTQTLYVMENGTRKDITFGDLVGDFGWGIRYRPDSSVPPLTWRKIGKRLAVIEAKSRLDRITNDALMRDYKLGKPTTDITVEQLDELLLRKGRGVIGHVSGALAERMITEFLARVQYNNPGLGLKVMKSNALEDSVLKYDFKIELSRLRGIALDPADIGREQFVENKRNLGIQLTTTVQTDILEQKAAAVEKAKGRVLEYENATKRKVDDIVLISIPVLRDFLIQYERWRKEGSPSGGPEQYLSREEKLALFRKVTEGLLPQSEEELQKLVL